MWWLATLIGSLGVFIAADLYAFYLFFTIVSLSAYWLVVEDGTPSATRAGAIYVAFALAGRSAPACCLRAVGGKHRPTAADPRRGRRSSFFTRSRQHVGIHRARLRCEDGARAAACLDAATYAAAPIAAAAVRSGAAVKAGVIGDAIRFLRLDAPSELGLYHRGRRIFSAFYGVAIGLTRATLKPCWPIRVSARWASSRPSLAWAWRPVCLAAPLLAAFYALHHMLVKGGSCLAIGLS